MSYAQRYNATGVAQGAEFRANTFTTDRQYRSSVALDTDGDFTIAWESGYGMSQDGDSAGSYAQRYAGPEPVDLALVKTDSADPVSTGGVLSYTLSLSNQTALTTRLRFDRPRY